MALFQLTGKPGGLSPAAGWGGGRLCAIVAIVVIPGDRPGRRIHVKGFIDLLIADKSILSTRLAIATSAGIVQGEDRRLLVVQAERLATPVVRATKALKIEKRMDSFAAWEMNRETSWLEFDKAE